MSNKHEALETVVQPTPGILPLQNLKRAATGEHLSIRLRPLWLPLW